MTTCLKFIILSSGIYTLPFFPAAQNNEPQDSLTKHLQEIVVTAQQPATKLSGSTLISTISGSALQDIGTALEVLNQLPLINVEDSEVSVIGKSNIKVYIDGRPMHDNNQLQQLLSSDMKKVELLLAPGAAYESTVGAVIKITTRQNFLHGLSLSAQSQLQYRRKWSFNQPISLNYHIGGWDFFASGSIGHHDSLIKGMTVNRLTYKDTPTVIGSSQNNTTHNNTTTFKGGVNYTKGYQSAGAYYSRNNEHSSFHNGGTEWLNTDIPTLRDIYRHSQEHTDLVSVYYDNIFRDIYHLHFDGNIFATHNGNDVTTSYPSSELSPVNSTDRSKSTLFAGKLYLDFPLFSGSFTIGTQNSHTRSALDYRMLNHEIGSYIPSSSTNARQLSSALFASWTRITGPWTISLGTRYEYTDYVFSKNNIKDTDISQKRHMLSPDISIGYSFTPQKQLTLSYKTSTLRPPYSRLTGSKNYVGRHEIESGNPTLRDETMHDLQLFGMWKNFILQADYIRSTDTYAFVKQLYPSPTLQIQLYPINIDVSSLNIYLIWSHSIRRWRTDYTTGFYRQWLTIEGQKYERPILSYHLDNLFTLPYGVTVAVNANGQSCGNMHTNRFGTTWLTLNASISKSFLNKALTVKLSATDILNTANNDWTMDTYGISVYKRQSYDRRGVSLHIIYNLRPRKNSYKGQSASEAELKRL